MSLELLSTVAAVGTFVVIAATAAAAVVQLRHLRAQNQLTGLLTVLARVEDSNFNNWVDATREELEANLSDGQYRLRVQDGTMRRKDNPWLNLGNSYDWVGSLIKHGLIPAETFMDVYCYRVLKAWELMEDVVVISRRKDGPGIWENFEYLVVLARDWVAKHPRGSYPKRVPRLELQDRWLAVDAALLRQHSTGSI